MANVCRRPWGVTAARLAELFGRDLSGLDLLAVCVDGIHLGEHLIVVALGVDSAGRKHPLGLWEGTRLAQRIAEWFGLYRREAQLQLELQLRLGLRLGIREQPRHPGTASASGNSLGIREQPRHPGTASASGNSMVW